MLDSSNGGKIVLFFLSDVFISIRKHGDLDSLSEEREVDYACKDLRFGSGSKHGNLSTR